jgi:hypothetical protein
MGGMLNELDKAQNDLWHLNFIFWTGLSIFFSFCFAMAIWLGVVPMRGGALFDRDESPVGYWLSTLCLFVLAAWSIYRVVCGVATGQFPR